LKKVVIVLEGVTELVFLHSFLDHLVGVGTPKKVFWRYRVSGNWESRGWGLQNGAEPDLEILLICPGGDFVRSFIWERIAGWEAQGFSAVLGLRDLYSGDPRQAVDLEWNEQDDDRLTASHHIKTKVYFAVQEIEAWFILDPEMPGRFDTRLTPQYILDTLEVDVRTLNVETVRRPAILLDKILKLANQNYRKSEGAAHGVCSRLDFARLYLEERRRGESLDVFLRGLDSVLAV
jgi:hypothetical protein